MKRLTLILVMMFFVSLVCSAKKFYYNGVGFEHEKSWLVSGSPNGIIGTDGDFRFYISFSRLAHKHANVQTFIGVELEKTVEKILEQGYGNKKMKVRKKSEVMDGDINGIPAKYIDIAYTKGYYKSFYSFEWQGYKFDMELNGKGKKFHKVFKKIIKSFAFTPER